MPTKAPKSAVVTRLMLGAWLMTGAGAEAADLPFDPELELAATQIPPELHVTCRVIQGRNEVHMLCCW